MTIARPRLEDAACRGHEELYLKPSHKSDEREQMQEICAACWDRPECLAYALRHERSGFWAGRTSRDLEAERARFGITFENLSNELWAHEHA